VPSPVIGANAVRRTANGSCVEVGAGVAGVDCSAELGSGAVRWEEGGVADGRRLE
jgi:hypothetical protein